METKRLNENELNQAVEWIQQGELVAFPTDTVYGLGADATNEAAVQKVFEAKGRPENRPINVLISQPEDILKYAVDVSEDAMQLAKTFWPGPLTLILKSAGNLSSIITAGKDTVGLRIPDNALAQQFIEQSGVPLATPSANSSGRPSPTLASHVMDDLGGKIAGIIDGGPTAYGIESTILDFSDAEHPIILRPGNISKEAIEQVIQRSVYEMKPSEATTKTINEKHYEPKVPVFIVESTWAEAIDKLKKAGEKIAILANESVIEKYQAEVSATFSLGKKNDVESANRYLFQGLRMLEKSHATVILAESYPKTGVGLPLMNRLENASNKKEI